MINKVCIDGAASTVIEVDGFTVIVTVLDAAEAIVKQVPPVTVMSQVTALPLANAELV